MGAHVKHAVTDGAVEGTHRDPQPLGVDWLVEWVCLRLLPDQGEYGTESGFQLFTCKFYH